MNDSNSAVNILSVPSNSSLKIEFGKTKLEFKENGDIFYNGRLIESDKELVYAFRALVEKC